MLEFVSSKFSIKNYETLTVTNRKLKEAIATGLSRQENNISIYKYHLYDFARIMRGIATGSNEFFFLTSQQVNLFNLPKEFF